jgi:hypothetical protein
MGEENVPKEEGAEESQQAEETPSENAPSQDLQAPEEGNQQAEPSCCAAPSAKCAKLAVLVVVVIGAILILARIMSKGEAPAPVKPAVTKAAVVKQAIPAAQKVDPEGNFFLFVPGDDEVFARTASRQIDLAVKKLQALKRNVPVVTVKSDDPDYSGVIADFSIKKFPAVVAIYKGDTAKLLDSRITKDSLVAAFTVAE